MIPVDPARSCETNRGDGLLPSACFVQYDTRPMPPVGDVEKERPGLCGEGENVNA